MDLVSGGGSDNDNGSDIIGIILFICCKISINLLPKLIRGRNESFLTFAAFNATLNNDKYTHTERERVRERVESNSNSLLSFLYLKRTYLLLCVGCFSHEYEFQYDLRS